MLNSESRHLLHRSQYAGVLFVALVVAAGCRHDAVSPVSSTLPVSTVESPAPDPERGRHIYRTGKSPYGRPINARYGTPPIVVAASVLVCENCHSENGLGQAEGGIEPSDITWETLTKPYGTMTQGRRRPSYTEETLRRVITLGFDSGGATIGEAMPRYQLSREDLDDVIAYLKTLETVRDPGITDDTLRIGVFLPPASSSPSLGGAVREALAAFFDRLNEEGGVYGRQVELRWAEAPGRLEDRARAFGAFLDTESVFAVVSPFVAGMEAELGGEATSRKVPILGPLVLSPRLDGDGNRYVFYLDAGVEGQARALVRFSSGAHRRTVPPTAAILRPEGPTWLPIVEAVRDECRRAGWSEWEDFPSARDGADLDSVAARLHDTGVSTVLAIGLGDLSGRLLEVAATRGWEPELLLPGSVVGPGVFKAHPTFRGRVVVALPTLPSDQTPEAAGEYRDLSSRRALSPRQRATHWSALAAARLLVEGLRRSGRNLCRERLVRVLESLRELPTGFSPPLTFGPGRRVGAWGAYIVEIAPATGEPRPTAGWQDLDRR